MPPVLSSAAGHWKMITAGSEIVSPCFWALAESLWGRVGPGRGQTYLLVVEVFCVRAAADGACRRAYLNWY